VPERKPIYYKISRAQWRRIESAHNALERIEKKLADLPEPATAWVTTNSNGEKRINVEIYDDGSIGRAAHYNIEEAVPSDIDGIAGLGTEMKSTVRNIPVTVERKKVQKDKPIFLNQEESDVLGARQTNLDYPEDFAYTDDWNKIPGGSAALLGLGYNRDYRKTGIGSLCTPVHDGEEKKMITAGHNIDSYPPAKEVAATNQDYRYISGFDDLDEDFEPDQVQLDGGDVKIGRFDAATLELVGNDTVTHQIAKGSGWTGSEITGTVAYDHLKDIEEKGTRSSETFIRQGTRTGKNSEFGIEAIGTDAFRSTLNQSKTAKGDSGGPYYIKWATEITGNHTVATDIEPSNYSSTDTRILMAGVHQGNSENYPHTVATSMYRVEQELDVVV